MIDAGNIMNAFTSEHAEYLRRNPTDVLLYYDDVPRSQALVDALKAGTVRVVLVCDRVGNSKTGYIYRVGGADATYETMFPPDPPAVDDTLRLRLNATASNSLNGYLFRDFAAARGWMNQKFVISPEYSISLVRVYQRKKCPPCDMDTRLSIAEVLRTFAPAEFLALKSLPLR